MFSIVFRATHDFGTDVGQQPIGSFPSFNPPSTLAKGTMRHVIQSADPFIVPVTHQGADRAHDVNEPLRTITAANRGELMLAMPELAPFITEHANASTQRTMDAGEPLRTLCAGVKGGHFSVVTPILAGVGGRAG